MKIYRINYNKLLAIESNFFFAKHLIAKKKTDACLVYIDEALKLLDEFVKHDNLVEDSEAAYGFVRRSDADVAIMEAVEESKELQKKSFDVMLRMCKESGAAKTILSAKLQDGYICETVIRKDGAVAYDEFSSQQVREIENLHTKDLLSFIDPTQPLPSGKLYQEKLDIINVCRSKLGKGEFSDLEHFFRNKSNTYDELIEEVANED